MSVTVMAEDPGQPEIMALLEDGERYGASLYPAESNHFLSIDDLRQRGVTFFVARDEQGAAIGSGAISIHGDWAEIKRLWVVPAARGRGVSKAIMAKLESTARDAGIGTLKLETGIHNHESLALYRRIGFVECRPFAAYLPDPLSVFMERRL